MYEQILTIGAPWHVETPDLEEVCEKLRASPTRYALYLDALSLALEAWSVGRARRSFATSENPGPDSTRTLRWPLPTSPSTSCRIPCSWSQQTAFTDNAGLRRLGEDRVHPGQQLPRQLIGGVGHRVRVQFDD